ncbi:: hypothetical protein [Arcticibacter svalbardensis MN12-7]|uniref:Outer membrane protein beta-barrel domain-containing protein n=1 Tax=Arcticibacter svalbardensis MN12-7 TaxID=1150600 RepID=R9GTY2_9SPHI|nr:: hypothetical protein [Arcticibacter svalbardensis MN12-7]
MGAFNIKITQPGAFILRVSYPGYVGYAERFALDDKKIIDFGQLHLNLKSRFLKEIIIKGKAVAVKIKGDTTEFNAGSYVIEPHAKVEDLLKQLPGLRIDQNGKITANGDAVKKVLVDGEEFFGDDPTLVTRNIRGDMVDKVQLYDKKSDQATFTGIDDGKKEKTINIKLKEDKKNGYFGKLEGGAGNDGYYQAQAMLNSFKKNNKLAIYGISGNNGKIGLGWQDNAKYGASSAPKNSIMSLDDGADDFESSNSNYKGQGLPSVNTAGVHYDTKWGERKQGLNLNFKMGDYGVEGNREKLTQNNLPTALISDNSAQQFKNSSFRQKLDATFETQLDSSLNLKIAVFGSKQKSDGYTAYQTFAIKDSTSFLNNSNRNINNSLKDALFGSSAFLSKKFKKNRRTISLQMDFVTNNRNGEQFLKAKNSFYNDLGMIDSTQTIDQKKPENIKISTLSSNITYTEPLSKNLSLVFNTGFSVNQSHADRKSFNATAPGFYTLLDSLFSNNYQLRQNTQQFGAVFNYSKAKSIITAGLKTLFSDYEQKDLMSLKNYSRNFINLNPQASYQYSPSQQKSLKINYQGTTNQPTITQLQPFRNNLDPLNVFIGNANLEPSFYHAIDFKFTANKVLSRSGFIMNGKYSLTSAPIVNKISTDDLGKNTFQYVNLSDDYLSDFLLRTGFNKLLKKPELGVNLLFTATGNTYYNIINTVLNKTTTYNYSVTTSVSGYRKAKYSWLIVVNPNYNSVNASLPNSFDNSGWGLNGEAEMEIFLPAKFSLRMEGLYDYRAKTQSFNKDLNQIIWNSTLNRNFLKDKSLKFSVGVNDLLNQNNGFTRNSFNNMFVQEQYTTIKRYFLCSLSWDFNKTGNVKQ